MQAFDTCGLAQFCQIHLANRFQLCQHRIITKGAVTAYQLGTLFWWQGQEQAHQTRQAVFGWVGFATFDFSTRHQTQIGYPVRVDVVAGASRLGWVVANFCTILMAKEQFDCKRVGNTS